MQRTAAAIVMATLLLTYCGALHAQELGGSGDFVLGVERVFGVRGERATFNPDGPAPEGEARATTISLSFANPVVPYNIPRLSFDYFAFPKLSLGGAFGFSTTDFSGDGPNQLFLLGGTSTTLLLAPRIGYLHMLGRVVGIWPRGGFTYHSISVEGAYDISELGLNLECQFPILFAPHFGLLLGLSFDQTLIGNGNTDGGGADFSVSYRSIGLQVGLFGRL